MIKNDLIGKKYLKEKFSTKKNVPQGEAPMFENFNSQTFATILFYAHVIIM